MSTTNKSSIHKVQLLYQFSIFLLTVLVLFLSAFNIRNIHKPKIVLGTATMENEDTSGYWRSFLSENPDYIPGWIEINEAEEVERIDPNYFIP